MKYLRNFNENFEQQLACEELREFCEINLAYLVDDGYDLYVKEDRGCLLFAISIPSDISTEEDPDGGEFKWDDIKDHFIPFLTRLKSNYIINGKIQFFTNANKDNNFSSFEYYTIEEMIDDKPSELEFYLYEIEISLI